MRKTSSSLVLSIYSKSSIDDDVKSIQELNLERMISSIGETINLSYTTKKILIEFFAKGASIATNVYIIQHGGQIDAMRLKQ
jgi:hypothetical protein